MESQYSVLIYSKYSPSCQKLFSLLEYGKKQGIDIPLNLFCIDNKNIRSRIMSEQKINITIVPCILNINSAEGRVEKFDNNKAFEWVENVIALNQPPPQVLNPVIQPAQPKPSQPQKKKVNTTSINELLGDEEEENVEIPNPTESVESADVPTGSVDRNVTKPAPARIRKDEGNFEDGEFFQNQEQTDPHKEKSHTVKDSSGAVPDPHGTLAKVKQLTQEREAIENSINPQSKRPTEIRRS